MNTLTRAIGIVFLAASAMTPATAATVVVRGEDVIVTGRIQFGDDLALLAAVANDTRVSRAVLGSDGGFVDAAIAVGHVIRAKGLATAVWSAGKPHTLSEGALLGVHCASLEDSQLVCNPGGTKRMIEYLREVKAPKGLIVLQEGAGAWPMRWLRSQDLSEETSTLGRLVADSAAPCDDQECGDHERVPDAPPPRRYVRPPPPYGPPPGVLYDPWARRAVPCILTVLTLGALPVCI